MAALVIHFWCDDHDMHVVRILIIWNMPYVNKKHVLIYTEAIWNAFKQIFWWNIRND